MKHTRLSFSASPSAGVGRERVKQPEERWRDDPSVIKARLLSASISTAVASGWAYAVIRYIWKSYIPVRFSIFSFVRSYPDVPFPGGHTFMEFHQASFGADVEWRHYSGVPGHHSTIHGAFICPLSSRGASFQVLDLQGRSRHVLHLDGIQELCCRTPIRS